LLIKTQDSLKGKIEFGNKRILPKNSINGEKIIDYMWSLEELLASRVTVL